MKKIAKIQINLFQSDTYRAMLAKFGAPGALLLVRLQVMQQEGPLQDFTDERQLLILATEIGSNASTVADMLQTLQAWNKADEKNTNSSDARPVRPTQQLENKQIQSPRNPKSRKNPDLATPSKLRQLQRKSARKNRRQLRQQLRALKRDIQSAHLGFP